MEQSTLELLGSLPNLSASVVGRSLPLSTVTEDTIMFYLSLSNRLPKALTSVVVTMSADGLQVLVSGRAVPTLLRTGELGTGPAMVSG